MLQIISLIAIRYKKHLNMKSLVEALDKSLRDELWIGRNIDPEYYKFEDQLRKFSIIPKIEKDDNNDPTMLYLTSQRSKTKEIKLGIATNGYEEGFYFIYDNGTKVQYDRNKFFDVKEYPWEGTGETYKGEYLYAFSKGNAKILKDILLYK